MTTTDIRAYGKGAMAQDLVKALAPKIDRCQPHPEGDTRAVMIRETCWLWFEGVNGGAIAEGIAQDIDAALLAEIGTTP